MLNPAERGIPIAPLIDGALMEERQEFAKRVNDSESKDKWWHNEMFGRTLNVIMLVLATALVVMFAVHHVTIYAQSPAVSSSQTELSNGALQAEGTRVTVQDHERRIASLEIREGEDRENIGIVKGIGIAIGSILAAIVALKAIINKK